MSEQSGSSPYYTDTSVKYTLVSKYVSTSIIRYYLLYLSHSPEMTMGGGSVASHMLPAFDARSQLPGGKGAARPVRSRGSEVTSMDSAPVLGSLCHQAAALTFHRPSLPRTPVVTTVPATALLTWLVHMQ